MTPMHIAILATGNEIIQGDTLNTNAHHIAHALHSEGFIVSTHVTCGDGDNDIVEALSFLSKKHDMVILIGGLGPTSDDRTRFALGDFLNESLIECDEALRHIRKRLKKGTEAIDPGNYQQALFPKGSSILPNPYGSATGCFIEKEGKVYFLLPGPPRECLPMFNQYVLPRIQLQKPDDKKLLKWRLFGVAEGLIAQTLDDSLKNIPCETGYRLDIPYLEFKVRCLPEDVEKVKQIIDPIVSPHIIATTEAKASEKLRSLIKDLKLPIVIVDQATGGVLQALIQTPETYKHLSFCDVPDADMRFYVSGLQEYWHNEDKKTANLVIKYKNETGEGKETHELFFYSPLVLQYAAEYLSFRFFHLIEQLKENHHSEDQ